MSAITVLTITHQEGKTHMQSILKADSTMPKEMNQQLQNYLQALSGGAKNASIDIQVGQGLAVAASGTLTFTGAPTAAETMTINGVTFTARASGATGNEFNIGGTVTISATNLKNAVNASATAGVNKVVSATSAAGVVTFTCIQTGYVGNSVLLTESLTNATVSGAALTGGVNATANVYHYGL